MVCVFVKQREGQTQLEKEEKKQETRQSSKEGRGSRAHRTSSAIVTPLFGFYSESKRGALAGIEERGTMSLLAFLRDHCGQCVEDKTVEVYRVGLLHWARNTRSGSEILALSEYFLSK